MQLPTLPPELTKTERLAPLTAKPTGEPVTIDKAILSEIVERLAEAAGAVERGNGRAGRIKTLWHCTAAIIATGQPASGCPDAP